MKNKLKLEPLPIIVFWMKDELVSQIIKVSPSDVDADTTNEIHSCNNNSEKKLQDIIVRNREKSREIVRNREKKS